MNWRLRILGSSSAIPTLERNLSAQLVQTSGHYFLIDCGEGTQFQLIRFEEKLHKINHIFISHLHGDHIFGLPGLVSTMNMQQREKDLHIYSFPGLKDFIDSAFVSSQVKPRFKIIYHDLVDESKDLIFEDDELEIFSFPLTHSLPTCGFLFKEKPKPLKIKKSFVEKHKIPIEWFKRIKNGEDYVDEVGNIFKNETITSKPFKTKSFAYCSDTAYDIRIPDNIGQVDLLYHEATFSDENIEDAKEKLHSTARQAGVIARKSGAKQLIIGHFSTRYKTTTELLKEAKEEFEESIAAFDGLEVLF